MWHRVVPVFLLLACPAAPYSVLTHLAIIDSTWQDSIQPILRQKYPQATEAELREAHAHAYGGAIIQDLGYYPFGNHFFSDLVHYVRSGDFIENLLSEAQNMNEYAFALGSLAHYAADNNGHPIAVNRAVPVLYPKLARKFGPNVTYENNPAAHLKTEFGFDVLQVARQKYAPEAYHDFIGFQVSRPVIQRAFVRTYGIKLEDLFLSVDLTLGTYRYFVSTVIPEMTKVAWQAKREELEKAQPGITRDKFVYSLPRKRFEQEWGVKYHRPGVFARIIATLFKILPRVGPFAALSFRPHTPQTEKMFLDSFDRTLSQYRGNLASIQSGAQIKIPNENFDLGKPGRYGAYKMADKAYRELVKKLTRRDLNGIDRALRDDILNYYAGAKLTRRDEAEVIAKLKAAPSAPAQEPQ